jgi:hypothetical protein
MAPSSLVEPGEFTELLRVERALWDQCQRGFADPAGQPFIGGLSRLSGDSLTQFRASFQWVCNEIAALSRDPVLWITPALTDALHRRGALWQERRAQIASLVESIASSDLALGVELQDQADLSAMVALATSLRTYLSRGKQISVDANGNPIIGGFGNRNVRHAEPLFANVKVGGFAPVSVAMLDHFLTWAKVEDVLDQLDRLWPDGPGAPGAAGRMRSSDQSHRLNEQVARLEVLDRTMALGTLIVQLDAALDTLGVPPIDWTDGGQVHKVQWVIQLLDTRTELWSVGQRISALEQSVKAAAEMPNVASPVMDLAYAIRDRDASGYRGAWDRLHRLLELRVPAERRNELHTRLELRAPVLAARLRDRSDDPNWDRWLPDFEEAWQWGVIGAWLAGQEPLDVKLIQSQLDAIEDEIRGYVRELSSQRAWRHVNDPVRMTDKTRADLEQFSALSRRSASAPTPATRRAEVRDALDRCRPTIPAWIMPIYRIAEQLEIAPNLFDVAVVDDVSHGSLEWTILQYLAPKLVVVHDEEEASPAEEASPTA